LKRKYIKIQNEIKIKEKSNEIVKIIKADYERNIKDNLKEVKIPFVFQDKHNLNNPTQLYQYQSHTYLNKSKNVNVKKIESRNNKNSKIIKFSSFSLFQKRSILMKR